MNDLWKNNLRDIEPYVPGEQPKVQDVIKLNTNVEDTKKIENKIKRLEGIHNLTSAMRQNITVLGLSLIHI